MSQSEAATRNVSPPGGSGRWEGRTATPVTSRAHWVLPAAVILALIYLLTANWSPPTFVDAYTNSLEARTIAETGGAVIPDATDLTNPDFRGELVWVVESPNGQVSQYPPGAAIWGSMFYLLDTSVERQTVEFTSVDEQRGQTQMDVPAMWPGALAGATSALIAMVFFALTIAPVLGERRSQLAFVIAALGTGTWSIAADMLWQHGPAMMCISAGVYFASRDRFLGCGLAFAAALLVRPHTALIAACIGGVVAWRRRSIAPLLKIGIASSLGLVTLLWYNAEVWGSPSISGGYGDGFSSRVASPDTWAVLKRIPAAFVDPHVGIFITSPVLILGFIGLWPLAKAGRRAPAAAKTPDWAVGAALGAGAYMLLQVTANRVSGGGGFFGYRYPLEALMAAAPVLALATVTWVGKGQLRGRILVVTAALSVALHAYGAITTF